MLLTSLLATGIVPTLLRFHKYSPKKYDSMFYAVTFIIFSFLLICGLLPNNEVSHILKINRESYVENLVIYISIMFSLLYLFNRGILTATNKFSKIAKGIILIFIIRIIALFIIAYFKISNFCLIISFVSIFPFANEMIVFVRNLKICKFQFPLKEFWSFGVFVIKVSLIGVLYGLTSQIFVVHAKGISDSIAAALSFSTGLIGIIGIFNATMNSYFIGKLDARNITSIITYLKKLRNFALPYICLLAIICFCISYAVYEFYPSNSLLAATFCFITVFKAGIWFYLCMITLLTKTFNMLNIHIVCNLICFCVVLIIVNFNLFRNLSLEGEYALVCSLILLSELSVACCVLSKIRIIDKVDES